MEKHLKLVGLMKRNGDRRDSNLQAIQRRKKAGEGGILKISFRAVTCTMSAAAAGKLILSRDPEGFWRISANPVAHPHCRQLYICTPPHSHTQIIENQKSRRRNVVQVPFFQHAYLHDGQIRCTFKTRAPWTEQHAAHATSTLVAVVKYYSGMYRNKYYK